MQEIIKRPKGLVEIQLWKLASPHTPILLSSQEIPNAVVANAKEVIARSLGGDSNYQINTIEIYRADELLASAQALPSYPDWGTVKFSAVFSEDSFSGVFDKMVLRSSANGNFSEITEISLTKPTEQVLSIGWNIKPQ